ncbi:MAG: TlyA family RNA methyltransferase [Rubritalea sp.]|uniref:TlyA family RNA methyltransferase n=1 Tax=Rubritalea sp. TaxID=2109375 RepID=UPI00324204B9
MKERADALLVSRKLCDSREQAKRLILAGEVLTGTTVISKPSSKLDDDAPLTVKKKPKYVSRGGLKLEGALEYFDFDPKGMLCLDCGASTGGFTDCLLQAGAIKVHAIDVGTNQLVWKIRSDERVLVKEKFNARHMVPEDIGEQVDLCVTDVSFISLTKILPPLFSVLKPDGHIICLVKPQFELQRDEVGKGGIVREPELHQKAIDKIRDFVTEALGHKWLDHTTSPITGTDGNVEYLALLSF